MAVLTQTYYIYLRNLKVWYSQPANIVPSLFISAFLFVVFGSTFEEVIRIPGFPTNDYEQFLTAMILIQAVIFSGGDAGFAMLTDILSGYLDKLLLAPINRFSILFGSMLLAGTRALIQAVVIVLIAVALGVSFQGGVLGAIAVVLLITLFGLAWACLSLIIALKTKSAQATQSSYVLFFPFIFLTTAFMPRELLPGWFRIAVIINPVNYVLEAARVIIVEGWVWDTILLGVGVLAAMTLAFTLGAAWLYRHATA